MDNLWIWLPYPLVMTNRLLLNMATEIVDLPIDSVVIFHSYVNVHQRVSLKNLSLALD